MWFFVIDLCESVVCFYESDCCEEEDANDDGVDYCDHLWFVLSLVVLLYHGFCFLISRGVVGVVIVL